MNKRFPVLDENYTLCALIMAVKKDTTTADCVGVQGNLKRVIKAATTGM